VRFLVSFFSLPVLNAYLRLFTIFHQLQKSFEQNKIASTVTFHSTTVINMLYFIVNLSCLRSVKVWYTAEEWLAHSGRRRGRAVSAEPGKLYQQLVYRRGMVSPLWQKERQIGQRRAR
jgi:hypothetical protein